MTTQSEKGIKNIIVAVLAAIFMVSISGCVAIISDQTEPFGPDKLPKPKYLVGGGLQIDWVAPYDGTAYLVKRGAGGDKLIKTEYLKAGGNFEFSIMAGSQEEIEQIEKVLGCKLSEAELSLYFVMPPKKDKEGKTD
jgi:hypothetical protein